MTNPVPFESLYRFADGTRVRRLSATTALILGEDVNFLEQQLCRYLGVEQCITAPDVQTGLYIALRVAGVQLEDRVMCSGFAPGEVIRAILSAGAVPMPVDINPNTYNLDPYCLEYVIGKCLRTMQPVPKVLVASDTFGLSCNYGAIIEICEKHGITLIEDMSQSMGASAPTGKTGSFGRFAVTSLSMDAQEPVEGEGAAVICHSAGDEAELRRMLRQTDTREGDEAEAAARNSIRAGLAKERMEGLANGLETRRRVAREYQTYLEGHVKIQQVPENYAHAYSKFVVALPKAELRDHIVGRLRKKEIACGVFRPLNWDDTGEDRDKIMLVNAQNAYARLISLPIHSHLSAHVTSQVAQQLLEELEALATV